MELVSENLESWLSSYDDPNGFRMCRERQCKDKQCLEKRKQLEDFEKYFKIENSQDVSETKISDFKQLLRHSGECDATHCDMPFCEYLSYWSGEEWYKVIACIKTQYLQASLRKFLIQIYHCRPNFIYMSDIDWPSGDIGRHDLPEINKADLPVRKNWKVERPHWVDIKHNSNGLMPSVDPKTQRCIPRPGADYVVRFEMMSAGKFSCQAVGRVPGRPFEISMVEQFFITRKDYLEQYLEDICKLRNVQHQNIATLLWVGVYDESKVLFAFLKSHCDECLTCICGKVDESALSHLMIGLVDGVQYLHDLQLLYLNWSASSILFDEDEKSGKLSDFQYIYSLERRDEDDLLSVVECLDCSSIPVELLNEEPVADAFTDTYGLGCLLLQLISGRTLLYDQRHMGRDKKIEHLMQLFSSHDDPVRLEAAIESHLVRLSTGALKQHFLEILLNLLGPYNERMDLNELKSCLE